MIAMKQKKMELKPIARKDGDATKALIIECAGRLIAKHGYAATTSKMICEKANVNLAAVNYHFGGRDHLYVAILEEVHNHLLEIDFLNALMARALTPKERLSEFIDAFAAAIYDKNNWYVRVWAREVISPSPFITQILSSKARPKFNILKQIFSDLLELPADAPALHTCMLGVMAPFVLIFLANWQIVGQVIAPVEITPPELVQRLKEFVFTGLEAHLPQNKL